MKSLRRLRGLVLALMLIGTAPAGAAQASGSVRVSVEAAKNGYSISATQDIDQVIRFTDDRIANVWPSNIQMWTPRFSKGGRVLMLQANASDRERKLLPQVGRGLGSMVVELESGESLLFNLSYRSQPTNQVLEIYRDTGTTAGKVRPSAPFATRAAVEQHATSTMSPAPTMGARRPTLAGRSRGLVSQDGFVSPLPVVGSAARVVGAPVSSAREAAEQPPGASGPSIVVAAAGRAPTTSPSTAGYWLLEQAQADPTAWEGGPNTEAYRAFVAVLAKGKQEGADFSQVLDTAQKLSGVDDQDLVWLSKRLAGRVAGRPLAAQVTPAALVPVGQEATKSSSPEVLPEASRLEASPAPQARGVPGVTPGSEQKVAVVGPSPTTSTANALRRVQIALADGSSAGADVLLEAQKAVWNTRGGQLRKQLTTFITALVGGNGLEVALQRSGLSLEEVQRLVAMVLKQAQTASKGQQPAAPQR